MSPAYPHSMHHSSLRLSLLAEYLSLQPTDRLLKAAAAEAQSSRIARLFADRILHARQLNLVETPSEKQLLDDALLTCTFNAEKPAHNAVIAEHMTNRQRAILKQLYPSHPLLFDTVDAIENARGRINLLAQAMHDQTLALSKLLDAANFLTLIADHIHLLVTTYATSCPSSSSSSSSSSASNDEYPNPTDHQQHTSRTSCLGNRNRDDTRLPMYITSVPPNFRVRYLRKCWAFAAEALSAAVHMSTYLARQLQKEGKLALVPGIESHSKPCLTLFELPGGLTVVLRAVTLQRMAADARRMRELVNLWMIKQKRFLNRLQRDVANSNATVHSYQNKLAHLRRQLLIDEFSAAARLNASNSESVSTTTTTAAAAAAAAADETAQS